MRIVSLSLRHRAVALVMMVFAVTAGVVAAVRSWEPVVVNVRWVERLSDADRRTVETNLGLTAARRREETTWQYLLVDRSTANVRAIVTHAAVQDTHNIDRERYQIVDAPSVWPPALLSAAVAATVLAVGLLVWQAGALGALARWSKRCIGRLPTLRTTVGSAIGLRRGVLIGSGALSALVLALTAGEQIYDSNHYVLTVATAILAGDHPYRDFYEPGTPLAGYLAAGLQWLAGRRLFVEFLKQWGFIVAAVVLAFDAGLRLSRSVGATLLMFPLVLMLLVDTPLYHYSKLFFFSMMVSLGWRYIERPGPRRGMQIALMTALGFLYRNDYGLYLGLGSITAFGLARAAVPGSRRLQSLLTDAAAYAAVLLMVLGPWIAIVHASEGFPEYVEARLDQFQATDGWVYRSLLGMRPWQTLAPERAPVQPGIVRFAWNGEVTEDERGQLQRQTRLLQIGDAADGRHQYRVADVNDTVLLDLRNHVHDAEGIEWRSLQARSLNLPKRESAQLWLQQVALLAPIGLLLASAVEFRRSRRRAATASADVWRMAFAGLFLIVVCSALLREPSYTVTVAPLTAALSARFLVSPRRSIRIIAALLLASAVFAAVGWIKERPLLNNPLGAVRDVPEVFARLWQSPPDYGSDTFAYLRDCTVPGDRLLVTGSVPLHVSYYTGRPIAGGHVNWHHGWRSDPKRERQSLNLLRQQSVPFAFSTGDPLLDDFLQYPRIREYLLANYAELHGSDGQILVDRRRAPTGRYGPLQWPCFR